MTGRKLKRVGLSAVHETALKRKLLREACSAAWVDAQFVSVEDRGPDGREIVTRMQLKGVYPPQADTPNCQMRVCRKCGVPTPPICVNTRGVCLDCCCGEAGGNRGWGISPWAVVMSRLRLLSGARLTSFKGRW